MEDENENDDDSPQSPTNKLPSDLKSVNFVQEAEVQPNQNNVIEPINQLKTTFQNTNDLFIPFDVSLINRETYVRPTSSLTAIFEASNPKKNSRMSVNISALPSSRNAGPPVGSTKLTVYLPDTTPVSIFAKGSLTIREFILEVLKTFEQSDPEGAEELALKKDASLYHIRLHEEDGYPDTDWPAFDNSQLIRDVVKAISSPELCLCFAEADGEEEVGFRIAKRYTQRSIASVASTDGSPTYDFRDVLTGLSLPTIIVCVMNLGNIRIPYEEQKTRLRDLLPIIAKECKFRMLMDGFCFHLSSKEDCSSLMYSNTLLDSNMFVSNIKTKQIILKRREFADDPRPIGSGGYSGPSSLMKKRYMHILRLKHAATINSSALKFEVVNLPNGPGGMGGMGPGMGMGMGGGLSGLDKGGVSGLKGEDGSGGTGFVYTEATANAYQEWNIVKKNRQGRRQERVMGIDGKIIYNGKRGQSPRHVSNVHRAQREISSIRRIDILLDDPKSFQITWTDNQRDTYDMVYTCENLRDCQEIVSKLKFITRGVLGSGGGGGGTVGFR